MKESGKSTEMTLGKCYPSSQVKTTQATRPLSSNFDEVTHEEYDAITFQNSTFWYALERSESAKIFKSMVVPGLKCKLYLKNKLNCENANVVYLSVINDHADKPETIKYAIDEIDKLFHKQVNLNML